MKEDMGTSRDQVQRENSFPAVQARAFSRVKVREGRWFFFSFAAVPFYGLPAE
jgi:hypothetical protein